MGDGVLLFLVDLGKGLVQRLIEEQRVIAEAAGAALLLQQHAGAGALRDAGGLTGDRQGNRALEGALATGLALHAAQEQVVVVLVALAFAVHGGVAGGVYAGLIIQSFHGEAAVIGNGGQAGRLADGLRLDGGVAREGGGILVDGDVEAGSIHAHHVVVFAEDVLQFTQLVGIAGGSDQQGLGADVTRRVAQGLALGSHQLLNAAFAVVQQAAELLGGEGTTLAGALQLDEFALLVHDQVHVHLGRGVLHIAQVAAGGVVHHAHRDRCHLVDDGALQQLAFADELIDGEGQGDHRTGDGRGAGAAVSLEHIAVQGDGALAQLGQVNGLTQAAANQALDFNAAAVLLDAVALLALAGGRGQHGVFRRDPALILAPQEGRHALLHRGGADHAGIAGGNQAGARRRADKIGLNGNRTGLLRQSAIITHINIPPNAADTAHNNPN